MYFYSNKENKTKVEMEMKRIKEDIDICIMYMYVWLDGLQSQYATHENYVNQPATNERMIQ